MSKVEETTELARLQAELLDYKRKLNAANLELMNAQNEKRSIAFLHYVVDAVVNGDEYDDACKKGLCYVSEELQRYTDPLAGVVEEQQAVAKVA